MSVVEGNELWVSVDDFANEIIRWFLDVMDGHTIVITRGGEPFAYMVPAIVNDQLLAPSSTASAHTAGEAATGPSVAAASEPEDNA